MRKKPYLPKGDKNREAWLNNFAIEFKEVALKLGFTAEEITEVENFAAAYAYVLKTMNIIKSEEHEWTQYKELLADGDIGSQLGTFPVLPTIPAAPTAVKAGIFKSIAKVVQRIKNHPNYDKSIGKNLGIIGPEKVIDNDNAQVHFALHRSDNDGIALSFVKDVYDGVVVYAGTIEAKTTVTVGSEAGTEETEPVITWQEIGRAAISPFVDTRPNQTNKPETRYYRMRYMVKQSPIGKVSDTIIVISSVGADLANIVK